MTHRLAHAGQAERATFKSEQRIVTNTVLGWSGVTIAPPLHVVEAGYSVRTDLTQQFNAPFDLDFVGLDVRRRLSANEATDVAMAYAVPFTLDEGPFYLVVEAKTYRPLFADFHGNVSRQRCEPYIERVIDTVNDLFNRPVGKQIPRVDNGAEGLFEMAGYVNVFVSAHERTSPMEGISADICFLVCANDTVPTRECPPVSIVEPDRYELDLYICEGELVGLDGSVRTQIGPADYEWMLKC